MKQYLTLLAFFVLALPSFAQNTWGEHRVFQDSDTQFAVYYDWLRENISLTMSEDRTKFTIGGDDVLVHYTYDADNNTMQLTEVEKGTIYLDSKELAEQQAGFPATFGENTVFTVFTLLINQAYKLPDQDKNGFDNAYKTGYGVELLGNGNAYLGNFTETLRDGTGRIILVENSSNWQLLDGTFQKGVQHGFFTVRYSDNSTGEGFFQNGKVDGLWKYGNADGSKYSILFNNGEQVYQLKPGEGKTSHFVQDVLLEPVHIEDRSTNNYSENYRSMRFITSDYGGYKLVFPWSDGLAGGNAQFLLHLEDIQEEKDKKVEQFTHFRNKRLETSTATITTFKKNQKVDGKSYNTLVHLKGIDFEKKLYFQIQ